MKHLKQGVVKSRFVATPNLDRRGFSKKQEATTREEQKQHNIETNMSFEKGGLRKGSGKKLENKITREQHAKEERCIEKEKKDEREGRRQQCQKKATNCKANLGK